MNLMDLKLQIKNKNINNYYLFTGDEEGILNLYIQQIAKALDCVIKRVDHLEEVFSEINSKVIGGTKNLYVVRQDDKFIADEKNWNRLNNISGNLILHYPKIDARKRFFKYVEDRTVKFDRLGDEILSKYIQSKIEIDSNNCLKLIKMCNSDYLRIISECEKIKKYAQSQNFDDNFSFHFLDRVGAIHKEYNFDIFKTVESIFLQDQEVLTNIKNLKLQKVELLLISLMYTAVRTMMILNVEDNGKGICERTGLTSWNIAQVTRFKHKYDYEQCVELMRTLRKIEQGIKTGKFQENYVIDYILASIYGG